MELTLAEVRKRVPRIHAFTDTGHPLGVTELTPDGRDVYYEDDPYSNDFTRGDGTPENPYAYLSLVAVSAHYGVVDLWLKYRTKGSVVIRVYNWVFWVTLEGVVADDDHFTQLTPGDS